MEQYGISFPGLGIDVGAISPYFFGTPIRWYGVLIAIGFLTASFYALRRVKEFGLTEDNFLDVLLIGMPIAIVCARLFYVLFSLSDYRDEPIRALYVWEGGLAIYGGVIGAVAVVLVFGKVRKINPLNLLDIVSLGLLIGQAIGRWGNFVNREVFGRETEGFLRMVLTNPKDPAVFTTVHPLFLYESLWNLLGFVLLHYRSKKRAFSGEIFLMYIGWYGLGRSVMEGMRDESYILKFFWTDLAVDRMIALLSVAVSLTLLAYFYNKQKKRTAETQVTADMADAFVPDKPEEVSEDAGSPPQITNITEEDSIESDDH